MKLPSAANIAEEIDPGCDSRNGAAVITRDRQRLVGLLRSQVLPWTWSNQARRDYARLIQKLEAAVVEAGR